MMLWFELGLYLREGVFLLNWLLVLGRLLDGLLLVVLVLLVLGLLLL